MVQRNEANIIFATRLVREVASTEESQRSKEQEQQRVAREAARTRQEELAARQAALFAKPVPAAAAAAEVVPEAAVDDAAAVRADDAGVVAAASAFFPPPDCALSAVPATSAPTATAGIPYRASSRSFLATIISTAQAAGSTHMADDQARSMMVGASLGLGACRCAARPRWTSGA
jgi:hypothetical protein